MEERNVGKNRNNPKQGLTSAEEMTIEILEGLTNLQPNLWPLRA